MWDEWTQLICFATYSTATYGPKEPYSKYLDASCHRFGCCICFF